MRTESRCLGQTAQVRLMGKGERQGGISGEASSWEEPPKANTASI